MEIKKKMRLKELIESKLSKRIDLLKNKIENDLKSFDIIKDELFDINNICLSESWNESRENTLTNKRINRYNSTGSISPQKYKNNGKDEIHFKLNFKLSDSTKQKVTPDNSIKNHTDRDFHLNQSGKKTKSKPFIQKSTIHSVEKNNAHDSTQTKGEFPRKFNGKNSYQLAHDKKKVEHQVVTPRKKPLISTNIHESKEVIKKNIGTMKKFINRYQENYLKGRHFLTTNSFKSKKRVNNGGPRVSFLKSKAPLENYFFQSKYEKALAIFSLSNFLPLKKRLYLNLFSRNLFPYFHTTKSLMIQREICEQEKLISYLQSLIKLFIDDQSLIKLINNPHFIPSKTAQNSLNFISKCDEELVQKSKDPLVIAMFSIIYEILEEPYECLEDDQIITNLFGFIMPKYEVDSLKNLFLKVVIKKDKFCKSQAEKINKLVESHPRILHSTYVGRIDKATSFLTFIIKEIYQYACIKLDEGQNLTRSKKIYFKFLELSQKLNRLKML